MQHIPYIATDEQKNNLVALALHLEELARHPKPELKFNMGIFEAWNPINGDFDDDSPDNCGAVCCALGFARRLFMPNRNEFEYNYDDYRTMGTALFSADSFGALYDWCFNGCWESIDNTPAGAAARIRYALKHGIPIIEHGEPRLSDDLLPLYKNDDGSFKV